ncbi:hypothetical protein SNE40_001250 [Patella caerulea]
MDNYKLGPGSVYLPSFPVTFPVKSPSRPGSARSIMSEQVLETPRQQDNKPRLLNTVVFEEELDGIVRRLSRPTISTRLKSAKYRPQVKFVGMDYYRWNQMANFCEHHGMVYTNQGAVRETFKKTTKRPATVAPSRYRIPLPMSVW